MFNSAENITFKKSYYKKGIQVPKLNLDERKKQWLKIINKNPNLKKHEYKKLEKGCIVGFIRMIMSGLRELHQKEK